MTELGPLDFPRDRWGRPLITVPGQAKPQPYTRISSFGSVLENQFGLNKWKMRTMLRGALDRPDLRARAESKLDDDRFLDDIVEQLIEHGGGSRAANMGTAIHEVLSQVNRGTLAPASVPTDFRPHTDAWLAALDAHGFTVVTDLVETHLVNDEFRAAGSGDVFLRRTDGTIVACDIKTGKTISPRPIAYMVQLYLYATAQRYDVVNGERAPLGDIDTSVAYIAHIPATEPSCTFYEVNLTDTRPLALLAAQVKEAEKSGAKVTALGSVRTTPEATVEPGSVASPSVDPAPVAQRIEWLRERLRIIIDKNPAIVPIVRGEWPHEVPKLKEGNLTDEQCDTVARFFDRIEAHLGIPFGATDPGAPTTGVRKSKPVTEEQMIRDAFPDAVLINDDTPLTDDEVAELKQAIAALEPHERAWLDTINAQATAAKVPMTLKMKRTRGRAERLRAALACVELAEESDVVGTILRTVCGHNQNIPNFGQAFGSLTIDQATRLQRIAANIGNGTAELVFDGELCVDVRGETK